MLLPTAAMPVSTEVTKRICDKVCIVNVVRSPREALAAAADTEFKCIRLNSSNSWCNHRNHQQHAGSPWAQRGQGALVQAAVELAWQRTFAFLEEQLA